jgi:hypothetical protein
MIQILMAIMITVNAIKQSNGRSFRTGAAMPAPGLI